MEGCYDYNARILYTWSSDIVASDVCWAVWFLFARNLRVLGIRYCGNIFCSCTFEPLFWRDSIDKAQNCMESVSPKFIH